MRLKRYCGARTRLGTTCVCRALENGRCRLHGGASTGRRSSAGKARIPAAQVARWARWRLAGGNPGRAAAGAGIKDRVGSGKKR